MKEKIKEPEKPRIIAVVVENPEGELIATDGRSAVKVGDAPPKVAVRGHQRKLKEKL